MSLYVTEWHTIINSAKSKGKIKSGELVKIPGNTVSGLLINNLYTASWPTHYDSIHRLTASCIIIHPYQNLCKTRAGKPEITRSWCWGQGHVSCGLLCCSDSFQKSICTRVKTNLQARQSGKSPMTYIESEGLRFRYEQPALNKQDRFEFVFNNYCRLRYSNLEH